MQFKYLAFSALLLCAPAPAFAQDDVDDAEYIVDQLATAEVYTQAMIALGALMADSFQLEFAKQDIQLSEQAAHALGQMMAADMGVLMAEQVREDMISVYEATLSDGALKKFRVFLETPAGQEFAAAQVELLREQEAVGAKHAEKIAADAVPLLLDAIREDRWPAGVSGVVRREITEVMLP